MPQSNGTGGIGVKILLMVLVTTCVTETSLVMVEKTVTVVTAVVAACMVDVVTVPTTAVLVDVTLMVLVVGVSMHEQRVLTKADASACRSDRHEAKVLVVLAGFEDVVEGLVEVDGALEGLVDVGDEVEDLVDVGDVVEGLVDVVGLLAEVLEVLELFVVVAPRLTFAGTVIVIVVKTVLRIVDVSISVT